MDMSKFIISVIVFISIWADGFADIESDLQQARQYFENKEYSQAETLLKSIALSDPDARTLFSTKRLLADTYIKQRKITEAKQTVDLLVVDFDSNPELSSNLWSIAHVCKQMEEYSAAEYTFSKIIEKFPASEMAFKARMDVKKQEIIDSIKNGVAPQKEIDRLINEFSSGPHYLSGRLHQIALAYEKNQKYNEAKQLYKKIAENFPSSDMAIRAALDADKCDILTAIEKSDYREAGDMIDNFIVKHLKNPALGSRLDHIAIKYISKKQFTKANIVHQKIIDTLSGSESALKAQFDKRKCQILSLIKSGYYPLAQTAIDDFVKDYTNNRWLPWMLHRCAFEFYTTGSDQQENQLIKKATVSYSNAVKIWRRVKDNFNENANIQAEACAWLSKCQYKQGNYEEALNYSEEMKTKWPYCQRGWYPYYMAGICCERLKELGVITPKEADLKIIENYRVLLDKFPISEKSGYAQNWLDTNIKN